MKVRSRVVFAKVVVDYQSCDGNFWVSRNVSGDLLLKWWYRLF